LNYPGTGMIGEGSSGTRVACCGWWEMDVQRYGLVFVGLLIFALVLAVPVSGASNTFNHDNLILNLTGSPGVENTTLIQHVMAGHTSGSSHTQAPTGASAPPPVTVPDLAVFDTIGPGDSIQAAVDAAADGETIYLDPGTYFEHDITISKNITIRSNTSAGGNRDNTIIDAEEAGRIFNVTGAHTLAIDSLTLQNGSVVSAGMSSVEGGAIFAEDYDSTLIITSTRFSDCSVTGTLEAGGGAISTYGILDVTSSSFEGCSVTGPVVYGGAIFSGTVTTITSSSFEHCSVTGTMLGLGGAVAGAGSLASSTFTDCSVQGGFAGAGGAVYGADSITFSTFTGCSATGGSMGLGGAVFDAYSITGSSFVNCSATMEGGAIYAADAVIASTFESCHANDGGAISYPPGIIDTIDSSTFTGCTATEYGGAIFIDGSPVTIDTSSFTGCIATLGGGAIAVRPSALTITSSSFERCSAGSDGGGAILSFATTNVHFSRFYQNTATGSGTAIRFVSGTIDANNNWWGTNSGPGTAFHGPPAAVASWLVLGITADPSSITLPQISSIRTNLTYNSDGTNTAGGGVFVPNAIPNGYAVVSGPGIVAPVSAGSASGGAQTTYGTLQSGTPTIAGTVDGQTVYITLNVAQGTWTPVPTETPIDDDWPQVGTGASGGGGGGTAATTGSSALPLMTVTVNIGGDSKAWQAIVTGTKLSELIVTGTVPSGAGGNFTAPPGIIFQYISLVPARYDTITKAVINFTVPQSWLDENHIAPGSIVLYHQTANGWEALPTTVVSTKDGTVYFSGQSTGFSLFAIAGMPTVTTPATVDATQGIASAGVQTPSPAAAIVKAPVTTRTTAPPATPAAKPSAPSPLLNIVLAIAAIGVLAGGGFMARRWWVRRQNPALFEEY
jgi:hypothetical protein